MFIKNVDVAPTQYIASRQKKIAKLLEKDVLKVVLSIDISNNSQIFNFCLIDKIKHIGINKLYKKCQLVV